MIQGKNQYVLLGGFSHQIGQSLWALALGLCSAWSGTPSSCGLGQLLVNFQISKHDSASWMKS